nr:MAG TPA: hypothetical protein [Bacteriophage sp.]
MLYITIYPLVITPEFRLYLAVLLLKSYKIRVPYFPSLYL